MTTLSLSRPARDNRKTNHRTKIGKPKPSGVPVNTGTFLLLKICLHQKAYKFAPDLIKPLITQLYEQS